MRFFLTGFLITVCVWANAQAVWLESGLGYVETDAAVEGGSTYQGNFKLGLRALFPVSRNNSFYIAPHYLAGIGFDTGLWVNFDSRLADIDGLESYAGIGATLSRAKSEPSLGLALSAGLSYELSRELALTFVYTHRPLLVPDLAQTFDLSVGLAFNLE